MIVVAENEAKATLPSLLDKAAAGEEVWITRSGKPLARLISAQPHATASVADAVESLKALRKRLTLGDTTIRTLRDEGRL
jgi:prevent-host-death family protein